MTPAERAALVERLEKVRFDGLELDCWEAAAEITRLAAEVERLRGHGWQPIETAPRDGNAVIGWFGNSPKPYAESVYWVSLEIPDEPDRGTWLWVQDADEPQKQPTHWRPQPTPPANQEGQADAD